MECNIFGDSYDKKVWRSMLLSCLSNDFSIYTFLAETIKVRYLNRIEITIFTHFFYRKNHQIYCIPFVYVL